MNSYSCKELMEMIEEDIEGRERNWWTRKARGCGE